MRTHCFSAIGFFWATMFSTAVISFTGTHFRLHGIMSYCMQCDTRGWGGDLSGGLDKGPASDSPHELFFRLFVCCCLPLFFRGGGSGFLKTYPHSLDCFLGVTFMQCLHVNMALFGWIKKRQMRGAASASHQTTYPSCYSATHFGPRPDHRADTQGFPGHLQCLCLAHQRECDLPLLASLKKQNIEEKTNPGGVREGSIGTHPLF